MVSKRDQRKTWGLAIIYLRNTLGGVEVLQAEPRRSGSKDAAFYAQGYYSGEHSEGPGSNQDAEAFVCSDVRELIKTQRGIVEKRLQNAEHESALWKATYPDYIQVDVFTNRGTCNRCAVVSQLLSDDIIRFFRPRDVSVKALYMAESAMAPGRKNRDTGRYLLTKAHRIFLLPLGGPCIVSIYGCLGVSGLYDLYLSLYYIPASTF